MNVRPTRCKVVARAPVSLVSASTDASDVFESVWQRLPDSDQENVIAHLPEDGGLFVKGQQPTRRGRPTPARRRRRLVKEVRSLERLAELQLPVPEVIAWGVERCGTVVERSFLVLREIPDAVDLSDLLADGETAPEVRREVLERAGEVVRRLHECHVFHRDLSARNLMAQLTDDGPLVWIIDCPRAEESRLPLRRSFLRRADLFRFARSLLKVGATDDEVEVALTHAGASPRLRRAVRHQVELALAAGTSRPPRVNLWLMLGV